MILLKILGAFLFGVALRRVVWPRLRLQFWRAYFSVYFYVRYVLPLDIRIVCAVARRVF